MSLKDEIAVLMCKRYCEIGLITLPKVLPVDVEIAEELVNKVLDATIETVNNVGLSADDEKAVQTAIQAIKDASEEK